MRNEGIVELYAPRRTLIGRDGITKIPHFLQRLSSKCVLVVTDKGLIKVGTAGKVTAVLNNANIQYVVYDGVEPNPTTRIVYDALHFYQEHQCDAIIAIGRRLADRCGKGREHPVRQRWKDSGLQRLQQVEKARYADHRRQHDGRHRLRVHACLRRHGRRDEDKDAHGGHELPCAFGSERPDAHGRHAAFSDGCHRY